MNDYQVFTDSACDIPDSTLEQWRVSCLDMTYHFDGKGIDYTNRDMTIRDFYQSMRDGRVAKTSAVNMEVFRSRFEAVLREGKDILYIAFASVLSNSCQVAGLVAKELMAQYPGRRIVCIDSRCASAGEGLLVYYAVRKRDEGASLEELADYTKATLPDLCHWFTVDNLVYLKRGGRVSAVGAFAGTLLQIKPVLHVDDEGRLINMRKIRGRKQAIANMAEQYLKTAHDPRGVYFISNGDCIEDARLLEQMIFERTGRRAELITDIGAVIGAHSGPGTLALFFLGSPR